MILTPILFLIMGYSLIYIIGRPVIQFASSSIQLFLLSDIPKFERDTQPLLAVNNQSIETQEKSLSSSQIVYPRSGYQYGRVEVESVKLDVPLYYGDSDEILREGAGQYIGSVYPGEIGTSLIGGHNSDEFGKLMGVQIKDQITIKASYGHYVYQVYQVAILNENDDEIKQLLVQKEQPKLVLYTCYPVDSIGLTDQRLFILCTLVQGPIIQADQ